jgi:hypothetical protein
MVQPVQVLQIKLSPETVQLNTESLILKLREKNNGSKNTKTLPHKLLKQLKIRN